MQDLLTVRYIKKETTIRNPLLGGLELVFQQVLSYSFLVAQNWSFGFRTFCRYQKVST